MFTNTELMNEADKLKGFAYRLTQNMPDAEDLLQSTLVRALEKKHQFQEGSKLFSWTSKIMYNMFVSNYRRKVKFETQYDPESFIEKEQVEASQEVKMEFAETQNAMDEISHDHREILTMVCIKGMPYAEVADELNVPVGTVRSRLSRARESLQHNLDNKSLVSHKVHHETRLAA